MYGRGRWTWFLLVAKEGRGRGSDSDAERPLGIGELRQALQSDFPGGGGRAKKMGRQNVACQEGEGCCLYMFRAGQVGKVESVKRRSPAGCMGRSGV